MEKTKKNRLGLTTYALYLPFLACLLLSIHAWSQGTQSENTPRLAVESMPVFPGGDAALMQYISNNLRYPISAQEAGIEGRVTIRFVVDQDGSIKNVEVIRALDPACDEEATRVIKAMPKWTPGRDKGVNVAVYYTIPIKYQLRKETLPPTSPTPLTLIQIKNGQSIITANAATNKDLPLIIVDNKQYQIDGLDVLKTSENEILKAVNLPNAEMESTIIIKGKAAGQMQGERGKNGIIMITTKKISDTIN